jgi:hypothetical protein
MGPIDKTTLTLSAVTTEEIPARSRTSYSRQSKYHVVLDPAIAQPDKWVGFPASFVAGSTSARKQTAIHEAATLRRIKVNTRVRGDLMYVRYAGPLEAKIAASAKDNRPSTAADAGVGLVEVE